MSIHTQPRTGPLRRASHIRGHSPGQGPMTHPHIRIHSPEQGPMTRRPHPCSQAQDRAPCDTCHLERYCVHATPPRGTLRDRPKLSHLSPLYYWKVARLLGRMPTALVPHPPRLVFQVHCCLVCVPGEKWTGGCAGQRPAMDPQGSQTELPAASRSLAAPREELATHSCSLPVHSGSPLPINMG